MNIVLIGLRGSGKTTVGKILARKLDREFIEMDELITRKAGAAIPEFVEKHGWEKFRELETEVTGQVAGSDNIVNASGGGVVTDEKNITKLKESGVMVWLQADIDTLLKRIGEDKKRPPLLAGVSRREEMETISRERKPLYQQAADLTVNTENRTPEEVADQVISLLAVRGYRLD
jgi:shikimate kinase